MSKLLSSNGVVLEIGMVVCVEECSDGYIVLDRDGVESSRDLNMFNEIEFAETGAAGTISDITYAGMIPTVWVQCNWSRGRYMLGRFKPSDLSHTPGYVLSTESDVDLTIKNTALPKAVFKLSTEREGQKGLIEKMVNDILIISVTKHPDCYSDAAYTFQKMTDLIPQALSAIDHFTGGHDAEVK